MTGGSDAANELRAAAARAVALTWHELAEAGCAAAILSDSADVHERERAEARHKAAAIAYAKAVDAAHEAAAAHRASPVIRRRR